jgi:hypothetical protein
MLNKGKRPDYIDEYKVSDVKFGALPPLLRNIKWTPFASSANKGNESTINDEYDVECTADMSFRSGLKFTVSTRYALLCKIGS